MGNSQKTIIITGILIIVRLSLLVVVKAERMKEPRLKQNIENGRNITTTATRKENDKI